MASSFGQLSRAARIDELGAVLLPGIVHWPGISTSWLIIALALDSNPPAVWPYTPSLFRIMHTSSS